MIEKLRLLTEKESTKSNIILLVSTLLIFLLFRWLYFFFSKLGEQSYFESSIGLEILKDYKLLVVVLLLNFVLLINYKKLKWSGSSLDKNIKIFIFIISFTLAWAFSTYDFNLYFNQGHGVDRIVLLVLPFLIFIHPLFIVPFIVLSIAITTQFQYPLHLFSWTDKKVLYYALILFNVCMYTKLLFKKGYRVFVILLLVLIGCNYFYAAVAKVILYWPFRNELQNLFVSSYINGWLGFLDESVVLSYAQTFKKINLFFIIGTFVIEIAALLLLKSRRICVAILILFSLLHIGIFFSAGIFFWKWIILDLAAVYLVFGLPETDKNAIFNNKIMLLSIFFMIVAIPFFKPTRLGWYDTPLSSIYTFEATGVSGEKYQLHTNFFSPYDFPFTQNRFYFLSRENILVRTYGSTENYEILQGIKDVDTLEELETLERSKGRNYYDPEKIKTFEKFLKIYFSNLNQRGSKESLFTRLPSPKHKLTFPRGGKYNPNDKIREIDVISKKALYKDDQILVLDETVVLTVCVMDEYCR